LEVRIRRLMGSGVSIHMAKGVGIQTVILERSEVATRLVLGKSGLGFQWVRDGLTSGSCITGPLMALRLLPLHRVACMTNIDIQSQLISTQALVYKPQVSTDCATVTFYDCRGMRL